MSLTIHQLFSRCVDRSNHPTHCAHRTCWSLEENLDGRRLLVRAVLDLPSFVPIPRLTLIFARWTAKTGSGPAGDVEIHEYLGETLFKGPSDCPSKRITCKPDELSAIVAELNYHQATLHLLVCPTQTAARTLADVLFEWSKLDSEGQTAVGRYAARGTLRWARSRHPR